MRFYEWLSSTPTSLSNSFTIVEKLANLELAYCWNLFWSRCGYTLDFVVCARRFMLCSTRLLFFMQTVEERKKKNYTRTLYQHECEPVIQMLNAANRVVA